MLSYQHRVFRGSQETRSPQNGTYIGAHEDPPAAWNHNCSEYYVITRVFNDPWVAVGHLDMTRFLTGFLTGSLIGSSNDPHFDPVFDPGTLRERI